MKWRPAKIDDISNVVTKGTTPTTYGMPFTDSGVNFIKAEALNGDPALNRAGFTFIAPNTHEKLKRSILEEGDVLVTIAGAQVGRCGIVSPEHLPANTNQAVGIIRVDRSIANPRYVYYYFKNPRTFQICQSIGGGQAAQPNINLAVLGGFSIPLPDLDRQHAIATFLANYDDLIENNRRRIALLEQAAWLLYEEWFVRFRFPGHEHAKFINGLPAGWKRTCVEDVAAFMSRGITPIYDDDASCLVINQKCIRGGRLETDLARRQSKKVSEEKIVQFGDVLINSTGEGTLGRVAQVLEDLGQCTVDSHLTIVRPKSRIGPHLFGMALKQREVYLSGQGRGATNQTELSKDTIGALTIDVPPSELSEDFEAKSEAFQETIVTLVAQNRVLASARNLLLPRLMSGEVEV